VRKGVAASFITCTLTWQVKEIKLRNKREKKMRYFGDFVKASFGIG
jgi:hypothetical protein